MRRKYEKIFGAKWKEKELREWLFDILKLISCKWRSAQLLTKLFNLHTFAMTNIQNVINFTLKDF